MKEPCLRSNHQSIIQWTIQQRRSGIICKQNSLLYFTNKSSTLPPYRTLRPIQGSVKGHPRTILLSIVARKGILDLFSIWTLWKNLWVVSRRICLTFDKAKRVTRYRVWWLEAGTLTLWRKTSISRDALSVKIIPLLTKEEGDSAATFCLATMSIKPRALTIHHLSLQSLNHLKANSLHSDSKNLRNEIKSPWAMKVTVSLSHLSRVPSRRWLTSWRVSIRKVELGYKVTYLRVDSKNTQTQSI